MKKGCVWEMDYISVKLNHLNVEELLVNSDFYPSFTKLMEEYESFQLKKADFQNKISKLIDEDANHRISYIYLQHMLKTGKYKLKSIKGFNEIDSNLQVEIVNFIDLEAEINFKKLVIEEEYKDLFLQYADKMFEIFNKNYYLNNAILITNYGMYKTILRHRKKDLNKIWKIVMRAFAKTAPLSTYTSITVDHDVKSSVSLDSLTLIKMYYNFLKLPEIVSKSNFVVDYEIEEDKLITKSCFWQLDTKTDFVGNIYKSYSLPLSLKNILPKGKELRGEELISIFGGKNTNTFEKIVKFQQYGLLKNSLLIQFREPTLSEFRNICYEFRNQSESINNIYERLTNINILIQSISETFDISKRRSDVEKLNTEIERCFELLGSDEFKNNINKTCLTESSYENKNNYNTSIDNETKMNLKKISNILQIFDPRLLLRFYIKDELQLTEGKLFKDIRLAVKDYLSIYERDRLQENFKHSIFIKKGINYHLYKLYELYQGIIGKTLEGYDVALEDSLLDKITAKLNELEIPNSNFYNFLMQRDDNEEYFLNNIYCNYLSFIFQHFSEKQKENALVNLRDKLGLEDEEFVLYSPSYGFNPNKVVFQSQYELVCETNTNKGNQITLSDCLVRWSDNKKRFELLKDGKRFVPVYLGSLSTNYLVEDLKIISYLCQSQFLTGLTMNYNDIRVNDFTQIGEIRYKNIVIQRRKKILHNKLIENLTEDFKGYMNFYKFKKTYKIPDQFFIRLYPVEDGKLNFIFGEKGMHKPVFINTKNSFFYEQMINHINSYLSKYEELAIVFEEASPNPYEAKGAVFDLSIFV